MPSKPFLYLSLFFAYFFLTTFVLFKQTHTMLQQLLASLLLSCSFAATTTISNLENNASDYLVVVMNNELIFDAIAMEEETEENTALPEVLILEQPEFGTIALNPDNSFTFSPIADVCEETDAFSYLVNGPNGIDTVQIKIEILCEPLTILGGFTPNNDGVNDSFTILGIQNFPNNSLAIFDANGKEIYYMKGYKNDWSGIMDDGTLAPESMYYYVFHDGNKYHSGYMKIHHK